VSRTHYSASHKSNECRARRSVLVLCLFVLAPAANALAQETRMTDPPRRVRIGIGGGLGMVSGGSRYEQTKPGGFAEGSIRLDVSDRWQIGFGGKWGTFAGTVPQFSVFEPFDHDPWLEHTLLFVESRMVLEPTARLRPWVGTRVGRVSELAEYAGSTIRRSGAAAAVIAGASWGLVPGVALDMSADLGYARFGEGTLEGLPGTAPPAGAVQFAARLGLEFGIRR